MNEKADFKKSKKAAENILKKYNIDEPIINVFEIAKNEGVRLEFIEMPDELKEVAGFFDPQEKVIVVNDNDPPNRQMFTIAHELGHYTLGHDTNKVLMRWQKPSGEYPPEEQEANCFAANLLVPEKMLKERARKYKLPLKESNAILFAKLFGVSKEMMRYRIKTLQHGSSA